MRGALRGARGDDGHMGIIPAYAGSTKAEDKEVLFEEDHPRVCGEHKILKASRTDFQGSSPRMRGALDRMFDSLDDDGIIPAYAGSTSM